MGTLAKGSFIITLVKIPRLILTYIHSQLKGKVSSEIIIVSLETTRLTIPGTPVPVCIILFLSSFFSLSLS